MAFHFLCITFLHFCFSIIVLLSKLCHKACKCYLVVGSILTVCPIRYDSRLCLDVGVCCHKRSSFASFFQVQMFNSHEFKVCAYTEVTEVIFTGVSDNYPLLCLT